MLEKFQNLNISEVIIRALNEMGFEEPTPIQAESIPVAMSGSDMIGQAQTGTGKTAAYGIPVLEKILKAEPSKDIQTVVLSPTRELAMQVAEELNHLAQFTNIQALPIYGGQDMERQLRRLRKCPQIIVATPGRLIDHMKRGTIDLSHITTIVLDEADEMLDMGFIDDINLIMAATPNTRQTLLFSATMPKPIQQLAETFLHDPLIIRMKAKEVTMDLIEQSYIEVPDRQKFDILCRLLDLQEPDLAIIFVRTKRRVDEVSEALKKRGYSAEGIHGDLTQAKRDTVIRQFREKTIDILVATDVAARGLDISGVTHVFNYDLPQDPESYVHRVGRTSRAAACGEAVTFVHPSLAEELPRFSEFLGFTIEPENPLNIVIRTKAEFDREFHEAKRRRHEERRARLAKKKEENRAAPETEAPAPETPADDASPQAPESSDRPRTLTVKKRSSRQNRKDTRRDSDEGTQEEKRKDAQPERSSEKSDKKRGDFKKPNSKKFDKKFDKKPKKQHVKRDVDYDDDNFGNSIHYQPKRRNLRNLGYDQPIHWEPIDPYHPSSQALSLPQIMPDEYPRPVRNVNGNRAPYRDGNKRHFGKNGNRR